MDEAEYIDLMTAMRSDPVLSPLFGMSGDELNGAVREIQRQRGPIVVSDAPRSKRRSGAVVVALAAALGIVGLTTGCNVEPPFCDRMPACDATAAVVAQGGFWE